MRNGRVEPSATTAVAVSPPWYAGLTRSHWRVLAASFLGWVFDGYEAYALVVVLPSALRTLLSPAQLASGAVWAGTAVGVTLLVGGSAASSAGHSATTSAASE